MSFEDALARLEEIAALLDRNEAPLKDALELCAEATELARFCRTQLAVAEGKLEQLRENSTGEVSIEPLADSF